MIGLLCEKPSQARKFASALGGMQGTYNGESYVIAAARGHLYEFADPSEQVPAAYAAKYKAWNVENLPWDESLFQWKRVMNKGVTKADLRAIQNLLSGCDELVFAGDVDPSGEGGEISYEVFTGLNLRPRKFSRMYFMDEEPASVQKAFRERKVIPDIHQHPEHLMAFYRSRWDFLSMQFTRIATAYGDGHSVLRQGRLKSAMVVLVGDALAAIKAYKKIPSYQNRFQDENGVVYTNSEEPIYKTKSEVPKVYQSSAVIVDSKELKHQGPPKLLNLADLSAMMASRGVKPKTVLDVYQKCYEAGVLSYPRTEDNTVTPEQFNDMLKNVDAIARLVGIDPALLTHRTPRKTHVKPKGAHGANRPGPNVPRSMDDLKQYGDCAPMLYEILAKNYLSILAEDYEYEQQCGHLELYPAFTGSANVPKKMGYKAVFNADADTDDVSSAGLGTLANPFIHTLYPPKPPTPTMKWLVTQLKKRDIGTGATQTSTISDITSSKSKYPLLKESRGKLSMSEFGEMSYLLLKNTNIGSLDVTERVQQEMKAVAEGTLNPDVCLRQMQQYVREDIETMKQNSVTMRKELGITMSTNVEKEYATGVWNGYDVKFNRTFRGHRFTDEEVAALLAGETINVYDIKKNDGSGTYHVNGKLANLKYNGHSYVGFDQIGFVNKPGVPDGWCGHSFTDSEKQVLLNGQTVHAEDFVSRKTGKKFPADVSYDAASSKIVPHFNN